ncbi:hypothetical protein BC332_28718 [Capsicum chinense]|nr:hypothetical protein BC332_28718 [Capsicum chinense]
MKKLREKYAKKDKKKEVHVFKKRRSNCSAAKVSAKRRRIVEVISRDELQKCSYSNIVATVEELEQLDLPPMNFASYHAGTSSMPSPSIPNELQVNVPQVAIEHDSFEDFSTTPPQFLKRESIYVSGTISAPQSKNEKSTVVGRTTDNKEKSQIRAAKEKQTGVIEQKRKDDDEDTCTDSKENLVKADSDSLKLKIKTYSKKENIDKEDITTQSPKEGEHSDDVADIAGYSNSISSHIDPKKPVVMELVKVNQEASHEKEGPSSETKNIKKHSRQEGDRSDDVVDVAGPTNADRPQKDSDKPVEMEGARVNQASSPVKYDKHDGIFEQHLDAIFYYLRKKYKHKNFPTNRYIIADCFFKVYIDKAYMNYYHADVDKELPTLEAFARTDEVAQIGMSLINTIKGLSTPVGQPWHMVNEVFVPINCDGAFHWVLAVTALKKQCIRVYDSMYSSQNRSQTSEIQKLAVILLTYLQYKHSSLLIHQNPNLQAPHFMESEILMDQAPVTPMKQPKTPQQPPPSTTDDGRVTQEFRTIEELVEKAIAPVKREYLRPPPSRPSTNNKGDIVEVQNDDVAEAKSEFESEGKLPMLKEEELLNLLQEICFQRSKHRNDPSTMKKLHEKHAKKVKKKEVHVSKKRGSNSSGGKIHAKRRRVVEVISRVELPKCSVAIPPHHADVPVPNCQFPVRDRDCIASCHMSNSHMSISSDTEL